MQVQKVDIGSVTLAFRRTGAGFPLLLLHGWPEFSLTWEPVMERLAGRFDLVAPDLRGFGDSDKPAGPFGATEQAADILALADALGLASFGVVAHDLGGAVAQALAASAADRIAGLFFFGFMHPGIGDRFWTPDRLHLAWYLFFHEAPFAPALVGASEKTVTAYFTYFLTEWAHRKDAFADVLPRFTDNFRKPGNVAGGFDYYRAAMPPRTNPPGGRPPPSPKPIGLPTAVHWPACDPMFPSEWTDTLSRFFPDLDLQSFDDVGHFPHRENPDGAAARIGGFFDRVTRGEQNIC